MEAWGCFFRGSPSWGGVLWISSLGSQGPRGVPRSRGDRDSALMQAREPSAPGALVSRHKPVVGSGRLPWPSQALSQTPRPAGVLRSCLCPRGQNKHQGQRARPGRWRDARLVVQAAASRARAGSCGLFTSPFCYFSTAAPEGATMQSLPGRYRTRGAEEQG